jgi:hypothetical protein
MDLMKYAEMVANSAREKLDLANARLRPEHEYASLPLCVIDAVFSIAARYEAVTKPTVIRFANGQTPNWPLYGRAGSFEHSVSEAIESMEGAAPSELAVNLFKNRQRTSTRNGVLKAEAVLSFMKALHNAGIDRFSDLTPERLMAAEVDIRKIPGQNISYEYFVLLAGGQTVKPDRMIIRFVADAIGASTVTPAVAREATIEAARILQSEFGHVDVRLLDSEIWSFESMKAAARRR